MGISSDSEADFGTVYASALALGVANQLTNILRDVGEDARRGRIYLPQDDFAVAGISEADIFAGRVTDEWMTRRADGRQILDEIEANDYDNFTKRAYVPKVKKLAALPKA